VQREYQATYGSGNYVPPVRAAYWGMRVMAYFGTLVFLVAAVGAFLYRRRRLERTRWFLWIGVVAIAFPYISALAGWILSEVGRQPWIVQGLLKTADANSPSVSTTTIALSLAVLGVLYLVLTLLNFVLLRRYARFDPPELGGEDDEFAVPAVSY
jgi:cytochrome d ubiquinol oxidase subunit I